MTDRAEIIDDKCRAAGCSSDTAKRHARLYLDDHWDPHPPATFRAWVRQHGQSVNAFTAWNAADFRSAYNEAMQHGLTNL